MTHKIDLRSDTVTQPTPAMREAMLRAPLGDDVMREDPTVNELEARTAALFGKEAALFTPTGTMANLLGVLSQTSPGDEVLTHRDSHVYYYEAGGYAAVAGCSLRFIDDADGPKPGVFTSAALERAVRPTDHHFPTPRLVTMENTHNRGGGVCWPPDVLRSTSEAARARGLRVHIDGARIWNAAITLGVPVAEITQYGDTVSACFSKGLGCPAGSILTGTREAIDRARHRRKMLGGGMRQAGVLAAAALHALDHHLKRLAEDHQRARHLAEEIAACPPFDLDPSSVETNLVYVPIRAEWMRKGQDGVFWEGRLAEAGVLCFAEGPDRLRLVTHLHVTDADIEEAAARIHRLTLMA